MITQLEHKRRMWILKKEKKALTEHSIAEDHRIVFDKKCWQDLENIIPRSNEMVLCLSYTLITLTRVSVSVVLS